MNQRTIVAMLLYLPLGGCSEPPQTWKDDFEFVWRGENITIYGFDRTVNDACGGSLVFADQYVDAVSEHLGFDPDTRIDYQWMSPEFYHGKCPPDAGSCTASGVTRSRDLPQMHEIVHAVTYHNIGVCPSLLEEGLAEFLGNPQYEYLHVSDEAVLEGEIEALLGAAPLDGVHYPRAGHFVAFLAETFGIEAVVDLCVALDYYATDEDWQRASEAVLGVDLERLLAQYEQYPACTLQQYRARLLECSGDIDHVIAPGLTTEFDVTMDCRDNEVIGPVDGQMVALRQVWVEQPLYAYVEVKNAAGSHMPEVMASQPCTPCSSKPRLNGNVHPTVHFALDEGLHTLSFYLPVDRVDTFHVTIKPLSDGD